MTPIPTIAKRVRAKLAYPVLALAMGTATIVGGLERSQFLQEATGTTAALAVQPVSDIATPVDPADFNTDVSHARVDHWVGRLTTSLRGDFQVSMDRMDKYATMINAKLDKKDMPRELIYVAMIESNFNPKARSKVGAVGMWQFMSATAREMGLTVTRRTDERKNPTEATEAALTYLGELHDRFGSWYLAAAAYNSGAGTVSKALRKVTGKSQGTDEDFFRIMSVLPKETQDYVPKLIASARVAADPVRYGFAN